MGRIFLSPTLVYRQSLYLLLCSPSPPTLVPCITFPSLLLFVHNYTLAAKAPAFYLMEEKQNKTSKNKNSKNPKDIAVNGPIFLAAFTSLEQTLIFLDFIYL